MPTCKDPNCGKPIDFALKQGDPDVELPFDRELFDQPGGEYAVWREGGVLVYRKLAQGEQPRDGQHLGTSHYRTCAGASQFSRRRAGARR